MSPSTRLVARSSAVRRRRVMPPNPAVMKVRTGGERKVAERTWFWRLESDNTLESQKLEAGTPPAWPRFAVQEDDKCRC